MAKIYPLRYHGGKWRLSTWIISHFPEHRIYVEPFGGSAAVLLNKPRSFSEVYNDMDSDVFNYFRVIRDEESRNKLIDLLCLTPYSRDEFNLAYEPTTEPIEKARRLIVRAQMGFGTAGAVRKTKKKMGKSQEVRLTD